MTPLLGSECLEGRRHSAQPSADEQLAGHSSMSPTCLWAHVGNAWRARSAALLWVTQTAQREAPGDRREAACRGSRVSAGGLLHTRGTGRNSAAGEGNAPHLSWEESRSHCVPPSGPRASALPCVRKIGSACLRFPRRACVPPHPPHWEHREPRYYGALLHCHGGLGLHTSPLSLESGAGWRWVTLEPNPGFSGEKTRRATAPPSTRWSSRSSKAHAGLLCTRSSSGHTADVWRGLTVQNATPDAEGSVLNAPHLHLCFINIKAIYESVSETPPLPKSREKRNDLSDHVWIFWFRKCGPRP